MDFLLKQKEIFEKLIGKSLVTKSDTDIPDTILPPGDDETETEIETERDALSVTCNGKKYYYCLGEILTKEFDPTFLNAFMHDSDANAAAKSVKPPVAYRIHFCIYQINVKAVVPFLEFWMTQTGYGGADTNGKKIWEFPQFEVTLTPEAMKDHSLISDELLTAISENGKLLGIYSETMALNSENVLKTMDGFIEYDTKPMEDDDNESDDMDMENSDEGGVESDAESGDEDISESDAESGLEKDNGIKGGAWFWGNAANPLAEKQELFIFMPYSGLVEMKTENGTWAILDEIMNHQKIGDVSVSAFDSEIFYQNPDLMTLYGSESNPLDEERETVYHWMEWNEKKPKSQCSISKVPQEIPYCLYLCEDKKEEDDETDVLSEDESSEVEESSEEDEESSSESELEPKAKGGNEDVLEEEKPAVSEEKSPKEKYTLSEKEHITTPPRVEDDYGYYWYFTNENMSGQKNVKRYAVFMYNTYYNLETKTKEILAKLGMEMGEAVDDAMEIHDSIYFQRDGIPLWCVKHAECFTEIDGSRKLISNETKST